MNYFDYNQNRHGNADVKPEPEYEMLTFTGNEKIDVVEDHGMTVDDVRNFIRNMHAHAEAQKVKQTGNVVALRKESAA
ncbi:MAG: hypothetical protein AAGC71_18015 [Pseudomonadota bacterium]